MTYQLFRIGLTALFFGAILMVLSIVGLIQPTKTQFEVRGKNVGVSASGQPWFVLFVIGLLTQILGVLLAKGINPF